MIIQDKIFDMTDGKFNEIKQFASEHPAGKTFNDCLERLKKIAENWNADIYLYSDFAPYSLYFVIKNENGMGDRIMNGGIIYHGPHDGHGSGQFPTLSVCVQDTNGWSIHT